MTWFMVDDGFAVHPKAVMAGNAALGLWVRAGSWVGQQLTDGAVPRHMLTVLGAKPKDAAALVAAGLWEVTDDGWVFHEWSTYQLSRAQVEANRARKAVAGAKGGKASGAARRRSRTEAPASPSVEAPASGGVHEPLNPYPYPSLPNPERESSLTRAPRAHPLPAGFTPSEDTRAWAAAQRPEVDLDAVTAKLVATHASSGQVCADWQGRLRTWVLNERVDALPAAVGMGTVLHLPTSTTWASMTGAPTVPGAPRAGQGRPRPAWCTECDERTRHLAVEDATGGRGEVVIKCPACHPERASAQPAF